MLDEISKRFHITKNYKTRLTKTEAVSRLTELLNEKMLFGKSRYEGFVKEERFKIKDNFVTKTKVPPIIEERIKAQTPELEFEVILKPTNGLIFRFLLSAVVFIVIMLFVPNDSANGSISNIEKAGYALIFSSFMILIVFLNAKDSFSRAKKKLIEALNLTESR